MEQLGKSRSIQILHQQLFDFIYAHGKGDERWAGAVESQDSPLVQALKQLFKEAI